MKKLNKYKKNQCPEWVTLSDDPDHWQFNLPNGNSYGVVLIGNEWGAYYIPTDETMPFGYLSNEFEPHIECGFGKVAAVGLKPNCVFASANEAKKYVEKHWLIGEGMI